ncbi:MAG: efflux RND transporter periplasmic adaptor subunit, partial [Proteobacteria bacterium]|nr:efflux RND transporter periplasmic adaptor subunit [Pseudomonadota bacterium]
MRKIFRFLLPLLLVGAGVVLFMQLKSSGPEEVPTVVTERRWPVEAVRVQFKELRPTVRLYGRVESPTESRIRSALSTDVGASFALVGQAVRQGEVLLQLDDMDATSALSQRQAELAEIEARIRSENSRYRNDLAALTQEQQLLALTQ